MGTLEFYDAAYPPSAPPAGADGVCGYIGGDAVNVWSLADWESQPARYRLPIFVRSNPPGPGAAADVSTAVRKLHTIGAPRGTLVAWDMETGVDASYISQVHGLIDQAGYRLIVYGSQSYVRSNRNPSGLYWGADWTGHPHITAGDVMTQWVSHASYDLSEAQDNLAFWDRLAAASLPFSVLDQEGPVMLLLPKGTPTPIAIPDGATSIRFTTVFGAAGGSWPSASLSVNWHGGGLRAETVTVDPSGTWPVLTIPPGVEGACVYREDDGSHYVSATVFGSASAASDPVTASPTVASAAAAGDAHSTAGQPAQPASPQNSFLHQPPVEWPNVAKRLLAKLRA